MTMKPKHPNKRNPKPNCKSGIQKVSVSKFDDMFKIDLTDPSTKQIIARYKKRKS